MDDPTRPLTENECEQLFDALFPHGLDGEDVLKTLAPKGWECLPLRFCFHPTAEQIFEESIRIHRNLANFRRGDDPGPPLSEPTLDEIGAEHRDKPIEPREECRELLGRCLWDVFAENHEVIAPGRRLCDLGSFRAAAGFIADWLNCRSGLTNGTYDYMDFYMGTIMISGRADLTPVYELIFQGLRNNGCDWTYAFPRLYLLDLKPLREQLAAMSEQPEWASYSPSEAVANEEQEREHEAERERLRASLDESHRQAVTEAQKAPPPKIVQAYRGVFGQFPRGWPPAA
jgi:hypothetical protein